MAAIVVLEVRDWLSRLSSAACTNFRPACVSPPSPPQKQSRLLWISGRAKCGL